VALIASVNSEGKLKIEYPTYQWVGDRFCSINTAELSRFVYNAEKHFIIAGKVQTLD